MIQIKLYRVTREKRSKGTGVDMYHWGMFHHGSPMHVLRIQIDEINRSFGCQQAQSRSESYHSLDKVSLAV